MFYKWIQLLNASEVQYISSDYHRLDEQVGWEIFIAIVQNSFKMIHIIQKLSRYTIASLKEADRLFRQKRVIKTNIYLP